MGKSIIGSSMVPRMPKSRKKPKNPAKGNPSKSSRPESAVLTVGGEGTESYDRPPTVSEIETQDREGMNTMFLVKDITVQSDSVTTGALAFYDKGSNVKMIRNELAEKLGLKSHNVKHKLVRSGGDVMVWDTTPTTSAS